MSTNSGSSEATYTLANDIKNTLIYIGNTFIDTSQHTVFLGNINKTEIRSDTTPSNFVEALIKGYTAFKTYFRASLPTSLPNDVIGNIMIRNLNDATYRSATSTTFNPVTMEINFSKILILESELLTTLDKIKKAYTFLHESVLKQYTAGVEFKVSKYTIDNQNKSDITIRSQNKTAFLAEIEEIIGDMKTFDFIKNDVFIIRRVLLFYELYANIYISMYLYDLAVERNASNTIKDSLREVISNTGKILFNLNKNFIFTSDETVPARAQIVSLVNSKAKAYRTSSDKINQLDEQVRNLKITLSNNMSLLNGGLSRRSKASLYEKVMLGIFIVSLFIIIAVSVAPLPKTNKLMVNLVVLGILIISAIIVDTLYRKKIEGFSTMEPFHNVDGSGNPYPSTYTSGTAIDQKNQLLDDYDVSYKSVALDFLSISIYLGLMLQSGRNYSGIDAAMKREITYFTQMSQLIDTTNDKVYNVSLLARLDAMTSASKITFFVSLGIILGGAIVAYIIVDENIKYQPYIIGVTGLLILFALMKYLYETMKRVRNDPRKFYWNKPSNIGSLDEK